MLRIHKFTGSLYKHRFIFNRAGNRNRKRIVYWNKLQLWYCSSKGFLLLLQYFEIMVTRKENKIIRGMKSFNRVYSHLFGVSYIITLVYHNEYVYYNRPILTFMCFCFIHMQDTQFFYDSYYRLY
jgi:hypothetical protein